jgi:hypothetical protein
MLAHHVVLALPGCELHHRDAVARRERLDLGVERLGPVRQHGGGSNGLAQVLPDEPHHPEVALQFRDVQVAVDTVDALQLEDNVAGQDIGGRTG